MLGDSGNVEWTDGQAWNFDDLLTYFWGQKVKRGLPCKMTPYIPEMNIGMVQKES